MALPSGHGAIAASHRRGTLTEPYRDGEATLFPIIETSTWTLLEAEQMGTKPKVWLEDPRGSRWLFKQVREDDQGIRGEDWAEKLACELGRRLAIPVATVELARHDFKRGSPAGIISRTVLRGGVAEGWALEHGNELLLNRDPSYARSRRGEVPGYTVEAVWDVLAGHAPTPGQPLPHGAGVHFLFGGFLLLDALIANTDRHHENWAVIRTPDGSSHLAPSFDHASSLGFQEPQHAKEAILAEGRIDVWLRRGRTKFQGRPRMIDLTMTWLERLTGDERAEWHRRLSSLSEDELRSTIEDVPSERMSQVDRRFAYQIVTLNRSRLLDELARA